MVRWLLIIMLVAAPTTACDKPRCEEGATRESSYRENTFEVCRNGKWVSETNPNKPDNRTDV